MEEMIVKDVEQMIINNDGNVIKRHRYFIEGRNEIIISDVRERFPAAWPFVDEFFMRAHMRC